MQSITIIFPGQGTQYVGMGNGEGSELISYFKKADELLNYPLSKICKEGPAEKLKLTENTQPAILTYSVALFHKLQGFLEKRNAVIEAVLGHSVGEYSALVASGALSFEDAVQAVHFRGLYMQEAVPVGIGKMAAILRVPVEEVRLACEAVSTPDSVVVPANFNDPSQTVISGHAEACDKAIQWLENNVQGRFRVVPLEVSAPFHSPLMKPAAEKLAKKLEEFTFRSNKVDYLANRNAERYVKGTDPQTIKQNLIKQVCDSVLWTQSINKLSEGTLCIEVGPGKTQKGMIKKIRPDLKVISLDQENALEELGELL